MTRLTPEVFHKEYDRGRVVTVEDPSLGVEDGELITVVGPSGCGKSITLCMIAGLESPSDGTIRIGSEDVADQHTREHDVAMVFQNYALYPYKTATQNVVSGLWMNTDLSRDERRERVRETAAMIGIEDLLDDRPDELSDEQRQRVALGCAIVCEPDVFPFDEPLSDLDTKLRTTIRAGTQRLQNELGITSLCVTYGQEEATMMNNRIVILNDGKLQQISRSKDMYESPASEFVGGFVDSSSMNFLDVSVEHEGDRLVFVGDSPFSYRLSESFSTTLHEATGVADLRVGIRPENVVTASSGENVVGSTIGIAEPVGSDNYLHLDIGPDFIARVDSDVEPETDETVGVTSDESDPHVFHPRTGESFLSCESEWRATPTQQV